MNEANLLQVEFFYLIIFLVLFVTRSGPILFFLSLKTENVNAKRGKHYHCIFTTIHICRIFCYVA